MKLPHYKLLAGLTALASLLGCKEKPAHRPLIIAHRGLPYHAPEETGSSYSMAAKLGVDYLEADLQRTKDGVIICLHDENLRRTTNVAQVYPEKADLPVSEFTYSELMKLDAGTWFNELYPERAKEEYKNIRLLTLNELIDIAQSVEHPPGLYLETKHPVLFPGIEKELHTLLAARGYPGPDRKVILQTFEKSSLVLLNKYFPDTPKCLLLWQGPDYMEQATPEAYTEWLDFACNNGTEIIGPSFPGSLTGYPNLMQDWMLRAIRKRGLKIHAYTFDTEEDIKKFAHLCDGIFTNRTDLAVNGK